MVFTTFASASGRLIRFSVCRSERRSDCALALRVVAVRVTSCTSLITRGSLDQFVLLVFVLSGHLSERCGHLVLVRAVKLIMSVEVAACAPHVRVIQTISSWSCCSPVRNSIGCDSSLINRVGFLEQVCVVINLRVVRRDNLGLADLEYPHLAAVFDALVRVLLGPVSQPSSGCVCSRL